MFLKDFQNSAIKKMLERSSELLDQDDLRKIVLDAPTGSGKTIMMAEILKQISILNKEKYEISFIWTAPRSLHYQSLLKLNQYYKKCNTLSCSEFSDLTKNEIIQNEILFLNWESINKKNNLIVKENEKNFYLDKIIENTKKKDRKLILIIDESHHHASSAISKELIKDLNPDLCIEVSATPVIENPDDIVKVHLKDVIQSGMIKKTVKLNPNFSNLFKNKKFNSPLSKETNEIVLTSALKKYFQMQELYKKNKIKINPLLLIQLPDRKMGNSEDQMKNKIIDILKKNFDITLENRKLAIYLSNEKINLANISKNENETQVLIFKQAIALGWDCPRAQILVLFREWKSLTFSVQTVGRIMRMPEPLKGHYNSDLLNHSYIYTNLQNIEINEDLGKSYLSFFTSKRFSNYKKISLDSFSIIRQREKTRLDSSFIKLFLNEANNYNLKKKIKTNNKKVSLNFITDFENKVIDELNNKKIKSNFKFNLENENDLQHLFDYFIIDSLKPFFPELRSQERLKRSIYNFFDKILNINYETSFHETLKILLSEENKIHFKTVIDNTKERYIKINNNKEAQVKETKGWELPVEINLSNNTSIFNVKKCSHKPFYYDFKFKTEENFINYLECSNKIEWWFKNGTSELSSFAIPYADNDQIKLFYIDFIVKLKNGKIGLFDTKSGDTIRDSKAKIDGLFSYLNNRKTLIGGIVTNTDQRNYSDRWVFFDKKSKSLVENKFSNWSNIPF
jgi:type III restriction enzyme